MFTLLDQEEQDTMFKEIQWLANTTKINKQTNQDYLQAFRFLPRCNLY